MSKKQQSTEQLNQQNGTNPLHSTNWLSIGGALFKKRKSPLGLAAALGEVVTGQLMNRQLDHYANTEFYLDPHELGKGAGRLLAGWLVEQQPDLTVHRHFVTVNNAVQTLDDGGNDPLDLAINRYLASKMMLTLEGFRSSVEGMPPYYESFQEESKEILRTMVPGWSNACRQDVFLGKPFHGDAVFAVAQRLLTAFIPKGKKKVLNTYLKARAERIEGLDNKDWAHYYEQLLILTYGREDDAALEEDLEAWFEHYRDAKIDNIEKKKNWINTGIATASGRLHWDVGGKLLGMLFGNNNEEVVETVDADVEVVNGNVKLNGSNGKVKKARKK